MEDSTKNTKAKPKKEQSRTTDKGRICCKLFIDGVVQFVYLESEKNPVYFATNYEKDNVVPINQGEWGKLNYNKIEAVLLTEALREKAVVAVEDRKKFFKNLKEVVGVDVFSEAAHANRLYQTVKKL